MSMYSTCIQFVYIILILIWEVYIICKWLYKIFCKWSSCFLMCIKTCIWYVLKGMKCPLWLEKVCLTLPQNRCKEFFHYCSLLTKKLLRRSTRGAVSLKCKFSTDVFWIIHSQYIILFKSLPSNTSHIYIR